MENLPTGDTAPNKPINSNPDPETDDSTLGETVPTRNLSSAFDQEPVSAGDGETLPIRSQSFLAQEQAEPLPESMPEPFDGQEPAAALEPAVIMGDTAPIKVKTQGGKKSGPRRWPWVVLGLFLLIAGVLAGGYYGYQEGIRNRLSRQATEIAIRAKEQFDLGNQNMADGNYEMARKHFEYVAQIAPGFPGITQKLTQVMVVLTHTDVPPTAVPMATKPPLVTPTPDTRGVEDLIKQAQDNLRNKDWDAAIATLDNIRNIDPTYRVVDLDGMYYIALRFRGMDKILKNGSLEGGAYDLAQAESFAPIDHEAE